jgi:glycerol-3-phosphate O-acyltransferase / dihydroxyacetone phosphate acyltransferase
VSRLPASQSGGVIPSQVSGSGPTTSARDQPSGAGYALVRGLIRFLVGLFYRRVEVAGTEHVPAAGPLVVAANHHNSLIDPMLLIAALPRPLVTLAKAELFGHPLIGPFLRATGAVPVHRRQEAGPEADPSRNTAMFAATTATLRAGGAILIFPEGRTQPDPVLLPLRTGTARIVREAEAAGSGPVTLLPVGLVFHDPGTFRSGRALVHVGPPVATAAGAAGAATEASVRELTERLTVALRRQIVEAEDRDTLDLLAQGEAVWQEESGEPGASEPTRLAWRQRVMRGYGYLRAREAERVGRFQRALEAYRHDLAAAGLTGADLSATYPPAVVVRYALRHGAALLLGAPLAVWGLVVHFLPYRLTGAVVRRLHRTAEEEATDKLAIGVVLYPLLWALEAWAVGRLVGLWALGLFLALLLPSGFFALAWRERLDRVRHDARAFAGFLLDPDLRRRLRERRAALAAELEALAALVPDEVWRDPTPAAR